MCMIKPVFVYIFNVILVKFSEMMTNFLQNFKLILGVYMLSKCQPISLKLNISGIDIKRLGGIEQLL